MTQFKDHFSKQSVLYSRYRPNYPDELFKYLAAVSPNNELSWDCATGTGQAALGLVPYFQKIIASDPSKNQLAYAVKHKKIDYRLMPAERTDLQEQSIDLITVAQAIHWFNFSDFFKEANRVLKPGGIIAVWTYNLPQISGQADTLLLDFYNGEIHKYWPAERIHIEKNYSQIPFPFNHLSVPKFRMQAEWTTEEIIGFLYTWSAVNKFIAKEERDPVISFKIALEKIYPDPGRKIHINWPLTLLAGKK